MLLIFGYLGFNNYGDELLAQILSEKLLQIDPYVEIKYLSRKNNLIEHLQLLLKAKEIYAIGGMFQDLSSYASPLYYFFVLLLAKAFGAKIIIEAQGLGPLKFWFNRLFAKTVFRLADKVSVRNSYSSELLKQWQVPHTMVPDLAWSLKEKFDVAVSPAAFEKFIAGEKHLFISLKQTSSRANAVIVSDMKSSRNDKTKIAFLEMQTGDHILHQQLANVLNLKPEQCIFIEAKDFKPEELIYLFKNYCSKLITMRFHAAILAQIAGTEVEIINPDNDPKLSSI